MHQPLIPGCLIIKFTITQNAQYRNHFYNVLCLSEAKGMDITMLFVMLICLAFVGVIAIIAITIDIGVKIQKKISSRQIVDWNDRNEWEKAVAQCAEKWMNRMPTIPLKDEERLIIIDILGKQYKHSSLSNWQYAQLLSGFALNNRKECNFKPFKITEIDDGYAIYQAWRTGVLKDSVVFGLIEKFMDIVKRRTRANGLIEYREGFGDICIVDTIAFVCPLLVRYGAKTNKIEYIQLAMKQIREYYLHAYLEKYGLYAHGYDSTKGIPCESLGWGRGTGWWLLGILYCYNEINIEEEKEWLKVRILESADNILQYQRIDGGWSTQLISNWNYDSSVTAIFGTFLYRVYNFTKDEKYKIAADKALVKLMSSTRKDGAIENCEGACHGIGKYSVNYGISPFVQGMVLDMIAAKKDALE